MKHAHGFSAIMLFAGLSLGATATAAAQEDTTTVEQDTLQADTLDVMQEEQDTTPAMEQPVEPVPAFPEEEQDTMMQDTTMMMQDTTPAMETPAEPVPAFPEEEPVEDVDPLQEEEVDPLMEEEADPLEEEPLEAEEEDPLGAEEEAADDILTVVEGEGNFSTFNRAVQAAGLEGTLSGMGPYTIFAPTDEAFDKLPPGTLDSLLDDEDRLRDVLMHHIVSGELTEDDLAADDQLTSLSGESLEIRSLAGDVMVGNATIDDPAITAANGVVYGIDTVLMPPEPVVK